LTLAVTELATSISIPALATGYGRLSIEDFAAAAAPIIGTAWKGLTMMNFVFSTAENARIFQHRGVNQSRKLRFHE
jgi:hypothetical protein